MSTRNFPTTNVPPVPAAPTGGTTAVVPFERMTEFYCDADWHIMRLRNAVDSTLALYYLSMRLTHGGNENYHASVPQVMHHFARSESTFRRAYGNLVDLGLFVLVESGGENWEANIFSVLPHKKWVENHPGQCAVTFDNNWADGYDSLGIALYNVTGGKVRFRAFQIGWYRNSGLTDDEITLLFKAWYPDHAQQQKGKKWRNGVGYQFGKHVERVGKLCHESHDRLTILQNVVTRGKVAKARVN